jgi:hypothetical protein
MRNYRNRLIAVAGAVVAAAAVAVSGLTGASAAVPAPRPAASGIEHFQLMTTSATSSKATIIATGVFTAGGIDNSGVKPETFIFPAGKIHITHRASKTKQRFNVKTCLLTVSQSGTYKLIGGTGAYAGISGHGTYKLSILAVAARSKGKCSMKKAPVAWEQLIKAHGPVKL